MYNSIYLDSDKLYCIALCEVINEGLNKKTSTIWTHPDEDSVITRFFFVFKNSNPGSATKCSSTNEDFIEQVQISLSYFDIN